MDTFLERTTPKAKKNYRCYLCGLRIPIGEKHVKDTQVIDGDIAAFRMHNSCEELTKKWTSDDWEYHDEWEFRERSGIAHPKKAILLCVNCNNNFNGIEGQEPYCKICSDMLRTDKIIQASIELLRKANKSPYEKLKERYDIATELLDGVMDIVEIWSAESPAQKKWKEDWFKKLRELINAKD